jgi:hypothetical protein
MAALLVENTVTNLLVGKFEISVCNILFIFHGIIIVLENWLTL